ncbi:hypothetical protein QP572_10470 [Brevibacterium sp. UMB10442]|nr:hypothetical protein [Brevibacterium sp. UMB10442]
MKNKTIAAVAGAAIIVVLVAVLGIAVASKFGFSLFGKPKTEVTAVVGSEKEAFFKDQRVVEAFANEGFTVKVTTAGSLAMANSESTASNDFAFPSSESSGQAVQKAFKDKARNTYTPFFSPIAIATFEPVVQVLAKNGVAHENQGIWEIDMAKYLELVKDKKRWSDLKGNKAYKPQRNVLITSTDIRKSNSAVMYMTLASYVMNNNSVVTDKGAAEAQVDDLSKLFLNQGYAQGSSAAPFERYLSRGMGEAPMVIAYEGQFLGEETAQNSRIRDNMVLAYPNPTVFSTHTGVTFTENGDKVMELLSNDEELAKLLAEHGFRSNGPHSATFDNWVQEKNLSDRYRPAGDFVELAQVPSSEITTFLVDNIGRRYDLAN